MARQITDPIGNRQSDSTGYVMKLMKLPFDTIMTSEYCRCKQTAEYFNLGVPIKEYQALTYYVYDESNRYTNTMNLYASKAVTVKNYTGVTHAGFLVFQTLRHLQACSGVLPAINKKHLQSQAKKNLPYNK